MRNELIHVAVGVIVDHQGRILIAQRHACVHQGGLWEFPGGKVNEHETGEQALHRELSEELGITITDTQPLIQISHDYGDKKVLLDVYTVINFLGIAEGKERQKIKWVTKEKLDYYRFPAANQGIVKAVQLPPYYMITGEYPAIVDYQKRIDKVIKQGVRLVQLRAKQFPEAAYLELAKSVVGRYQSSNLKVILNSSLDVFLQTKAAGLHLRSQQLGQYASRPVSDDRLLSASVHNENELRQAMRIQVDFVVISPVSPTSSHPDAQPLGWDGLSGLIRMANCPVYALGGLGYNDLEKSISYGAQGVAGISAFNILQISSYARAE